MPSSCAVENCKDRYAHYEGTSFHKFPFKRKDLLEKWSKFVAREPTWQPSKWSSICSRHFRKEDFTWTTERKTLKKTSVPSVRQYISSQYEAKKSIHIKEGVPAASQEGAALMAEANDKPPEEFDPLSSIENVHHSEPKVNCRLCGLATSAVVTFATNFEMYGTIQKCLPTLNIQQDDHLPKEICHLCLQHLENFSRFIDKVLETQSELQRRYRSAEMSSRSSSNIAAGNSSNSRVTAAAASVTERQLKIKQEPLAVRVKQEVAEGFESSFLSSDDMDMMMGADESCCEPQPPHEEDRQLAPLEEQKFQFCDFPMLNTQDIINNCDIMEIINLDDPFINIPDDDANTLGEQVAVAAVVESPMTEQPSPQKPQQQLQQPQQPRHLPSAHELLQTHLLIEEHNYAYAAEDFKEEWQIKNFYKTEKTEEGYEQDEGCGATGEQDEDYAHDASEETAEESKSLSAAPPTLPLPPPPQPPAPSEYTSLINLYGESRSAKPIVTSVSAISESSRRPPQFSMQKQQLLPSERPKPNIVVLNESIVKSSSPFQLHACAVCQLKFFSVESLSQHQQLAHAHQEEPMVCVPSANILANNAIVTEVTAAATAESASVVRNCKIEAGCEREVGSGGIFDSPRAPLLNEAPGPPAHFNPTTEWHNQPFRYELPKNLNLHRNTATESFSQTLPCAYPSSGAAATVTSKRQINILEMRQTFLRHPPPAPHPAEHNSKLNGEEDKATHSSNLASNCNLSPNSILENSATISASSNDETIFKVPNKPAPTPLRQRNRKINSKLLPKTVAVGVLAKTTTKSCEPHVAVNNVLENYKQLRKRFRQLQRKCKSLQQNATTSAIKLPIAPLLPPSPTHAINDLRKFQCRNCPHVFPSIYALLHHKQTALPSTHHIRKPRLRFSATCSGCEKFFRSKLALRNHMRYICPTLSLRCLRQLQIQTFKCRCCRRITFTHWRLYRRHELRCKQKQQAMKKRHSCQRQQQIKPILKTTAQRKYKKHKSALKPPLPRPVALPSLPQQQYSCPICPKSFGSSNSLSQHRITHCSERLFKCSLCVRIFKRRNGLAQHMNGYHLQLKPYACATCGHSYALKCDMLRCRHSTLQRAGKRVV